MSLCHSLRAWSQTGIDQSTSGHPAHMARVCLAQHLHKLQAGHTPVQPHQLPPHTCWCGCKAPSFTAHIATFTRPHQTCFIRPPYGLRPAKNLCASARPLSLTLSPPPVKKDIRPALLLMQCVWSTRWGPCRNTYANKQTHRAGPVMRVDCLKVL
jgi:hypothetical protein